MTDRERFEAWQKSGGFEIMWYGGYFEVWQASRKQALSEAIAICDKQGTHEEDMGRSKEAFGCDLCGQVLANLANPEGEQG